MEYKTTLESLGFSKALQREIEMPDQKDNNYSGGRFGDYIRVEDGSLYVRDELGTDRIVIGKI